MSINDSIVAYRGLKLPRSAPFELRPSSPGQGWGVFATRKIRDLELIIHEKPLFGLSGIPQDEFTEFQARFKISTLSTQEKATFARLRDNGGPGFATLREAIFDNALQLCADPPVWAVYPLVSRFNHSCRPNAALPLDRVPGKLPTSSYAVALRDIEPGEEIFLAYLPVRSRRRARKNPADGSSSSRCCRRPSARSPSGSRACARRAGRAPPTTSARRAAC
jgi:hypothetical protein